MRLDGEAVVITGAGRGIGEAVAKAFARAGANVTLIARTRADIERVAEKIATQEVGVLPFAGDVSERCDLERGVAATLEKFGRVDALVNAAGIYGPIGPLIENEPDEWVQAIRINLLGTLFAMRAVLPHMLARHKGAIINFSGGGAVSPFPRFSAYATSKAAVVRLTETIAEEVKGSGVRANAIAPGAANTRLLDQVLAAGERAGKEFYASAQEQKRKGGTPPEKAAELAVFLASPAGAGITGRLISAVWDDWKSLPERATELNRSAMFTLRRIDGRHFTEVR
ncbi:MAG TPA: SDR family oxidoreductase [Candidatus Acidoferrales bacterium]|nr:SDR family oxidoreductase [Candidatus Acidoferrales bacterium]